MIRAFSLKVATGICLAVIPVAATALDLTVGSGAAQNCPQSTYAIAFTAAAIAYVEPAPVLTVTRYGAGQYSPSSNNDLGIGIGFAEITGRAYGFCVGALFRTEYRDEASPGLLDALVANHFGHPFDAGRTYQLSLSDTSFKADGVRIRRVADLELTNQWSVKIGFGASYLHALQGQQESVSGSVTATSQTYAIGAGTWLNTASNMNLANFNPFVAPGNPGGDGFSTDLEFIVQSTSGLSMDFIVMDALGRIYWHDVPQSLKTLNNATISYNANFDRDAFVTGLDSRVSFVQDLVPKYHLAFSAPVTPRLSAVVEDDFVSGYHFASLGARYGKDDRLALLNFDFRTKAVGIGAQWKSISALVTTNNIRVTDATVLGFSIQAVRAW
jgi:hypothetical protein